MIPRSAPAHVLVLAVALVAIAAGASPAARTVADRGTVDLLASAHPTAVRTFVVDAAFSSTRLSGRRVKADTAALTSTTCDGCAGHSAALHVVYVPRSGRADLDNVATVWAQECHGCVGTSISVQVVVLANRPTVVPDNRALSVTGGCDGCRVAALAFQVVLVADRATPMTPEELIGLQAWFDEQTAVLQASVLPPPPEATTTPTPTPTPTPAPTETPTDATTDATTTPAPPADDSAAIVGTPAPDLRRARRDATSALDELEALLASALDADPVSAEVDLSR